VLGSQSGGVSCWDTVTGEQRWSAHVHDGCALLAEPPRQPHARLRPVASLAHAGAALFSVSEGVVELSAETGEVLERWPPMKQALTCAVASPGASARPPGS